MKWINLDKLIVSGNRVDYFFSCSKEIECYFSPKRHLFVQFDSDISMVPQSILTIPFVGNVMQIAWLTDSSVRIHTLDKTFTNSLHNLRNAYQKMYPLCPLKGEIVVEEAIDNKGSIANRTGQLYTGGMDATTTYIRHRSEKPTLMLTYGKYDLDLFSDCNYCQDEESERNFQSDRIAAVNFAQAEKTDAIFIRSNYVTFFNMQIIDRDYRELLGDGCWHGIQHAMAILSVTAPVAYAQGIGTIYIASSNNPNRQVPCASDPSTDNEIKFASSVVQHDGYELTDEDKAKLICDYQKEAHRPIPLRVCSWNDHNCCSCEKCVRRMLQINAEGGNPKEFGFGFNGSLCEKTKDFLRREVQFMTDLNIVTWRTIVNRMIENYDYIIDKEVALYLQTYEFEKERKKGLFRYYRRNFFSIIKRKIKEARNRF